MSWDGYLLEGRTWKVNGVNHKIVEWVNDGTYAWATLCEGHDTLWTSSGGKKPRTFKGVVTCFQCLAKGDVGP